VNQLNLSQPKILDWNFSWKSWDDQPGVYSTESYSIAKLKYCLLIAESGDSKSKRFLFERISLAWEINFKGTKNI
jgi:hypothetical protein